MTEPRRDATWWLEEFSTNRHEAVLKTVRAIRQNQEYRKLQDLLFASLYAGRPVTGFGWSNQRSASVGNRGISLNVIRNMIGAVTSKIAAKSKPKPTFETEDGDAELREQAETLEKFVGGVFYESGVYNVLSDCFRDACTYGTAFLMADEVDEQIGCFRVKPFEMVADDGEGDQPANLYRRRYVDRLTLADLYPDNRDEILVCPRDSEDVEYGYQTTADQVLVTEAWHEGPGKKKRGWYSSVISNATLEDGEWDGPPPFAVLRWTKDIEGFFGVGLCEELRGIQTEINKLLMQIQRGHHLIAGHWLVLQGSTLTTQINNDLAAIVKYTGTAPQYQTPAIIAPEVYKHLWELYAKAFEISGISQLNATGLKPAGLDSGAAQRAYQDIQTERFLEVGQAYEEFVIEAARQVVRAAKRRGGSYKVRSVGKGSLEIVDWSKVKIDEQSYAIRVYPTSLLPSTPAGKIQWMQDMLKSGAIPPEDIFEVVDMPDTDAYMRRKLAARKSLEKRLLKMRRDRVALVPEPFDDLKLLRQVARDGYHEAVNDGCDEEVLDLFRNCIANTQDLLNEQEPPPAQAPMGAPPMGPPGAPPMPPPGAAPPPMPPATPMAA